MLVNQIELLALDIDGVITDGKVSVGAHGEETKGIAFRDLDALAKARREGLKLALVTGETGALQAAIADRLNADLVLSGAKDKVLALRTLSEEMGVPLASICFVGDADRDALAFATAGRAREGAPRARIAWR
jgi:3-deoxy-D-manno-octulosonate 8-phosphate phosphatase (KDO 8-P phosphatase)